ncbi:hypothetical protein [Pseudoxanthomonas wuyuanensis]|uniref:Uncharacterized protein n=1 Tax=Pseudoxanthomonas wuyuanensis TaxID=1073196 RepID=A0A286DBQ2_9GAMM|nr:hypothetical protein [Pseudoxanthomonas wuyuanensis]KAF1721841.1 hypothetical protein CSC75_05625 [Pseudoxanthomonas wuyuanensis]SOD56094.1 hypothetical protein SAMN06296416_108172 [Pseudoxanthomonas wuyuanensis]
MRRIVLLLSAPGILLFGGAFSLSFLNPLLIERAAREVMRIEVERRIGEKIDNLSSSRVTGLAQRALKRTNTDIERTQRAIREELPRKVANVVADMLDADCECRRRLAGYAERSESERLASLTQVRARLAVLIESTYASVGTSLMREFRIFSASNAVAFVMLGLVTLVRRRAALQLLLPAVVLVGAVALTGGLYLFNQDWLHTIVFGQYVGLTYAVYLAGVALLLADVVFNRARVATRIVNFVLQAAGSTTTAIPC